jgi:hypothetical protein
MQSPVSVHRKGRLKKLLRDLETPIIYAMTIVASAIEIAVWTARRGPVEKDLLSQFERVFGSEYGILFAIMMLTILTLNRRWKGLVATATAWFLLVMLQWNFPEVSGLTWDEFFAVGAMLASLFVALCARYKLLG